MVPYLRSAFWLNEYKNYRVSGGWPKTFPDDSADTGNRQENTFWKI